MTVVIKRYEPVKIPDHIYKVSLRYGLGDDKDDIEFKLRKMVEESKPIKHPKGNRKFGDWVLQTKDNSVRFIHHIVCTTCNDYKRLIVYDECPRCYGEGCKTCNGQGDLRNYIPCPDCTHKHNGKRRL